MEPEQSLPVQGEETPKSETSFSEPVDPKLVGLGGWLILVGIGVVLSPVKIFVGVAPLYKEIFSDGTWAALTTPGGEVYNALWAPFLIGEMVCNGLLFLASCYLIYLFFSKHRFFPKLYIGILAFSLIFIPFDAWVGSLMMPGEPVFDSDTAKEFGRTLIASSIWIPYMLVSKRVKATFVQGPSPTPEPAPTPSAG